MAPSHKLVRQRANDRIRRAKQREGPREGLSSVSISITLFISSHRYYAITNTDYTQYYINTCNGTVRLALHDACSICLVTVNFTCYTVHVHLKEILFNYTHCYIPHIMKLIVDFNLSFHSHCTSYIATQYITNYIINKHYIIC